MISKETQGVCKHQSPMHCTLPETFFVEPYCSAAQIKEPVGVQRGSSGLPLPQHSIFLVNRRRQCLNLQLLLHPAFH